jgi:hypothetical protein
LSCHVSQECFHLFGKSNLEHCRESETVDSLCTTVVKLKAAFGLTVCRACNSWESRTHATRRSVHTYDTPAFRLCPHLYSMGMPNSLLCVQGRGSAPDQGRAVETGGAGRAALLLCREWHADGAGHAYARRPTPLPFMLGMAMPASQGGLVPSSWMG